VRVGWLHETPFAGYGFVINDHYNVGDLDPEYWAPIEVNTKYGGGLGCGVTGKDAGGWSVSTCFFVLDRCHQYNSLKGQHFMQSFVCFIYHAGKTITNTHMHLL
jgi:hypothetical protein